MATAPVRAASAVAAAVVTAVALAAGPTRAEPPPLRLAVEGHASAFSDQPDRSLLNVSFGGALRFAYRREGPDAQLGGLLVLERNAWFGTELDAGTFSGVWNVGAGVERVWARGRLRSALTLGLSILNGDTPLHQRGTSGFFVDLRPVALRWPVHAHVAVELTPLGLNLLAPALRHPTLLLTQYRTTLGVEVRLP
ncbi:MAG: hypothetical protein AAF447_04885 [Myxococcota bacterium]